MLLYKVARAGVEIGMYDLATIRRYLSLGNLKPTDHAWTEGMEAWKALADILAEPPTPVASPILESKPPACCPNCGSTNIRAAKAIHMAGTVTSSTSGSSFGGASTAGGPRRSSSRMWSSHRTTTSKLAEDLAPPQLNATLSGPRLKQIGWFAFGAMLVWTIIAPLYAWKRIMELNNSPEIMRDNEMHALALDTYDRTWYCSKCASKFLVD